MLSNHDPAKYRKIHVPDCPRKITFGTQAMPCNLRCPKCLVWGINNDEGRRIKNMPKEIMSMESVIRVFDEVKDYKPTISPGFWIEPLAMLNIEQFIMAASSRGLPVNITTNGLLVTEHLARIIVDHVALVSVSIDATTPEVLEKTRATDKLTGIEAAVLLLLEKRGNRKTPRITVSFTVEKYNAHQRQDFLEYWIKHVDAVKINEVFAYTGTIGSKTIYAERIPCREIYDAMIIDYNGEARLCCLDGLRQTNVGNVLQDGVLGVWRGEALTKIRCGHETDFYDDLPLCKDCTLWSNFNIYEEKRENDILVRSSLSDQCVYYNRIDRMDTWSEESRRLDLKVDAFLGGN
jgi:sulfatase maturation enzyme AslB (radical SAM superfamily)